GHTITLKNTGNIATPEGTDVVLDTVNKRVLMAYDGSKWAVVWGGTLPGVGSANTTLSNLASPTAINHDLLPDGALALGSASAPWTYIHGRVFDVVDPGTPPPSPTTGNYFLYGKGDGLYYKGSDGVERGPLTDGSTGAPINI